jgi:integral membrane sensor domain MASE1
MAAPAAIGILGAFVLLWLWGFTARFPWSSDPWLMHLSLGIMASGPIALVAAILLHALKQRK